MKPAAAGAQQSNSNGVISASQSVDRDAILNIIRLANGQSQKLAEQWVPITKDELEQDDGSLNLKESFPFRPEQAGLGADISQATASDWKGVSIGNSGGNALEKLRRQMLGSKAVPKANAKRPPEPQKADGAHKKRRTQDAGSSDEDEEGGRSAAFKPKRVKPTIRSLELAKHETVEKSVAERNPGRVPAGRTANDGINDIEANGEEGQSDSEVAGNLPSQRTASSPDRKARSVSFLDQILTDRSRKKKKKKRKKLEHDK